MHHHLVYVDLKRLDFTVKLTQSILEDKNVIIFRETIHYSADWSPA